MSDTPLQFDTAEYAGSVPPCVVCKAPIVGERYLLGANNVCAPCRAALIEQFGRPTGLLAIMRGAALGAGAAGLGALVWWAIREATDTEWGILAIGLAWLIAYAVRYGAGGGGRWQQVIATALTYLAIVLTYAPMVYTSMLEGTPDPDTLTRGLAAVAAAGTAFVMPYFMITGGGVSSVLWFVILGIAMWGAWRRTAGVSLVFTGPFAAPPAATGAA